MTTDPSNSAEWREHDGPRLTIVSHENWIAALPAVVREAINARMKLRELRAGEELYAADEPSLRMHQVVDGFIRTIGHHANGEQSLITIYGRGNCFTETAIVAHRPHNHTTIAMTAAQIAVLERSDFWDLYRAHHEIPESLCRKFAIALSRTIRNRELRATRPLSALVAMIFADLADVYPLRPLPNAREIEVPITQTDIAAYLGVTRQSVQREISMLKELRIVEKVTGVWLVRDTTRLRALAL